MIRVAEAVLNGHPDKFCDILADRLLAEAYRVDPECYGQIEVGVWSDALWFSGAILTRAPVEKTLEDLVSEVGREIGYTGGNHIDATRYRIHNDACLLVGDPLPYTRHVNDQCIAIGWAGYDERTRYLAPEQFLAHTIRGALVQACVDGPLAGQGPDGKLLIRLREEGQRWILEQVLVTLQQRPGQALLDLTTTLSAVLRDTYARVQAQDRRWARDWGDVEVLLNPNGPLLNGGSDGDNGQTGRKLVMDYYGPRVPVGGGALSGKDLTHIDRVAAYGARHAAVTAVASGATTCQVTLVYAPNRSEPQDVIYDMSGRGQTVERAAFRHDRLTERFARGVDVGRLGTGVHFFDRTLPWNAAR